MKAPSECLQMNLGAETLGSYISSGWHTENPHIKKLEMSYLSLWFDPMFAAGLLILRVDWTDEVY